MRLSASARELIVHMKQVMERFAQSEAVPKLSFLLDPIVTSLLSKQEQYKTYILSGAFKRYLGIDPPGANDAAKLLIIYRFIHDLDPTIENDREYNKKLAAGCQVAELIQYLLDRKIVCPTPENTGKHCGKYPLISVRELINFSDTEIVCLFLNESPPTSQWFMERHSLENKISELIKKTIDKKYYGDISEEQVQQYKIIEEVCRTIAMISSNLVNFVAKLDIVATAYASLELAYLGSRQQASAILQSADIDTDLASTVIATQKVMGRISRLCSLCKKFPGYSKAKIWIFNELAISTMEKLKKNFEESAAGFSKTSEEISKLTPQEMGKLAQEKLLTFLGEFGKLITKIFFDAEAADFAKNSFLPCVSVCWAEVKKLYDNFLFNAPLESTELNEHALIWAETIQEKFPGICDGFKEFLEEGRQVSYPIQQMLLQYPESVFEPAASATESTKSESATSVAEPTSNAADATSASESASKTTAAGPASGLAVVVTSEPTSKPVAIAVISTSSTSVPQPTISIPVNSLPSALNSVIAALADKLDAANGTGQSLDRRAATTSDETNPKKPVSFLVRITKPFETNPNQPVSASTSIGSPSRRGIPHRLSFDIRDPGLGQFSPAHTPTNTPPVSPSISPQPRNPQVIEGEMFEELSKLSLEAPQAPQPTTSETPTNPSKPSIPLSGKANEHVQEILAKTKEFSEKIMPFLNLVKNGFVGKMLARMNPSRITPEDDQSAISQSLITPEEGKSAVSQYFCSESQCMIGDLLKQYLRLDSQDKGMKNLAAVKLYSLLETLEPSIIDDREVQAKLASGCTDEELAKYFLQKKITTCSCITLQEFLTLTDFEMVKLNPTQILVFVETARRSKFRGQETELTKLSFFITTIADISNVLSGHLKQINEIICIISSFVSFYKYIAAISLPSGIIETISPMLSPVHEIVGEIKAGIDSCYLAIVNYCADLTSQKPDKTVSEFLDSLQLTSDDKSKDEAATAKIRAKLLSKFYLLLDYDHLEKEMLSLLQLIPAILPKLEKSKFQNAECNAFIDTIKEYLVGMQGQDKDIYLLLAVCKTLTETSKLLEQELTICYTAEVEAATDTVAAARGSAGIGVAAVSRKKPSGIWGLFPFSGIKRSSSVAPPAIGNDTGTSSSSLSDLPTAENVGSFVSSDDKKGGGHSFSSSSLPVAPPNFRGSASGILFPSPSKPQENKFGDEFKKDGRLRATSTPPMLVVRTASASTVSDPKQQPPAPSVTRVNGTIRARPPKSPLGMRTRF